MKIKTLVVGANSFVGSYLASTLQMDREVTGIYNNNIDRLPSDITPINIKNLFSIGTEFKEVYIVSAHIQTGKLDNVARTRTFEVNVDLVGRICAHFSGSRIIFCSSVSVYNLQKGDITEKSSKGGLNEYGISKLWGEKIVTSTSDHAIVRFSSIYGAGMSTTTIIPAYVRQAITKGQIEVFGTGERLQDYLHVKDAVGYLTAACNYAGNGEFLACSASKVSNRELAEKIAAETNASLLFNGIDTSPSFSYDNTSTTEMLKYQPQISLHEGLKDVIKWIEKKS